MQLQQQPLLCHSPSCSCVAAFVCSRCKAASYCSKLCQGAAWASHKAICRVVATAKPELHEEVCPCCPAKGLRVARPAAGSLGAASAAGDLERVVFLCSRGVCPNTGPKGALPLALAAAGGHELVVSELLRRGARLEPADAWGHTAIIRAVLGGHLRAFMALADARAQLRAPPRGMLYLAVMHAKDRSVGARARAAEVVAELLRRGVPASGEALRLACSEDALELARMLIEAGADVGAASEEGFTALHCASESASQPLVALLLDAGARVNATDNSGWTALHFSNAATEHAGQVEVVRTLMEAGGSPNAPSNSGSTPLWLAAQNNLAGSALLMFKSGGDKLAVKRCLFTDGTFAKEMTCVDIAEEHKHRAIIDIFNSAPRR